MQRQALPAAFRSTFGALASFAIGVQLVTLANEGHPDLVNHRHPDPFLDPANVGYGAVAMYVVMTLVLMLAMCAAVVAIGNRAPSRHDLAAAA